MALRAGRLDRGSAFPLGDREAQGCASMFGLRDGYAPNRNVRMIKLRDVRELERILRPLAPNGRPEPEGAVSQL